MSKASTRADFISISCTTYIWSTVWGLHLFTDIRSMAASSSHPSTGPSCTPLPPAPWPCLSRWHGALWLLWGQAALPSQGPEVAGPLPQGLAPRPHGLQHHRPRPGHVGLQLPASCCSHQSSGAGVEALPLACGRVRLLSATACLPIFIFPIYSRPLSHAILLQRINILTFHIPLQSCVRVIYNGVVR